MDKQRTFSRLQALGAVAVLRGSSSDRVLDTAGALVAGGVTGIEITFTTPGAIGAVRALDEEFGDEILLGMGTLTEPQQAESALAAGARYLVSPMMNASLARAMADTGLLVIVGALTPTEVVQARNLGADVVKIFPASVVGPGYIKSLHGPFPDIPFMPTGGISNKNVGDWLAAGAIAVGVGSGLCPTELILAGRFDKITAMARGFMTAVVNARQAPLV